MIIRLAAFLGVVFLAMSAPVSADPIARCVLEVDRATLIDGPCDFQPEEDGSFMIAPADPAANPYFAYVLVEPNPDLATGFWNGDPPGTKAHVPLGLLDRAGACWVNEQAKVCAYR